MASPKGRPSLLLLPAPPNPADRLALNAAYRPPLTSAITKLQNKQAGATLVIVVAAPFLLPGASSGESTVSWADAQHLVAGLYSIISVICAKHDIATEVNAGPGSVDARVILVDHEVGSQHGQAKPFIRHNGTIVTDLETFAATHHSWDRIFHVDNEQGYELLSSFQRLAEGRKTLRQDQLVVIEGGVTLNLQAAQAERTAPQTKTVPIVCLGGTFDHLHPGHKLLLTAAVFLLKVPRQQSSKPCRFIVGITGDELLKQKKYAEFVQSWDLRATHVLKFLNSLLQVSDDGDPETEEPKTIAEDGRMTGIFRNGTIEVECVMIQDAFGPTTRQQEMDVLVVSGETRAGGNAVNTERQKLGWHPLEIFEVDVLDAEEISDTPTKTEDYSTKISSTAIRRKKAESRI
ncbi:cytidylyltransferase [Microdochium trichocladiopsis]|uniref:Cytidylyltransferase n=1 Tax=Microdochium trichocladiopsis TaxID=1682393 RepID=A0A9P8XUD7_9PEZI|nr:cytidylyltransferase [Microdochium trichocladiopsis]KAH7018545.1 cytidylyltransferase [Microdochium trichocladiopsis]